MQLTVLWKFLLQVRRFPNAQTLLSMKLTVVLLLAATLQVTASAYAQRITLSVKDAPLETVFRDIRTQTGYLFLYSRQMLDNANKVNIQVRNATIEEVLRMSFRDQPLEYTILNKNVIVRKATAKPLSEVALLPVATKVTGKVYDVSGKPLIGATVKIKNSNLGAGTDANGQYTIEAPEDAVLVFSFIGYQTKEVAVAGKSVIDVILQVAESNLDQVVVVGYGTQKKVNLTGAIETLDLEDIKSRPLTNASLALQGKVAGAFISQNSGQPGHDNAEIRIRGVGTFNNASPLVIIDGIEAGLNDVNPKDIATISVLKDAASAAIYGNRAANGVILITTKRGKQDKLNVEYTGYYGQQRVTSMPKVLQGLDYLELKAEAYKNTNERYPTWYTDKYMDNYRNNVDPIMFPLDFDWVSALFKPAGMHDHYVSVSGGSKTFQHATSIGYLDQDGIAIGNNTKKLTFRSNLSSSFLQDHLRINIQVSGHEQTIDDLVDGMSSAIYFAYIAPPTIRMEVPGVGYSNYGYSYGAKAAGGLNQIKSGPLNLRGSVALNVVKGLEVNVSYGIYKSFWQQKIFRPTVQLQALNDDGSVVLPTPRVSDLSLNRSESITKTFNAYTNYTKNIRGGHNISAMVGFESREFNTGNYGLSRTNLSVNLPQFDFGDPTTQLNNSGASSIAWLSQFGRLGYNYKGKYLVETNLRYDGSSRFEKKWGLFPSVSAGWRISEEPFMKNNFPVINNLKFRTSWGRLGNESIGQYYAASDELSLNLLMNFNNQLVSAGAVTKLANRNTSWETAEQYNWGLDFDILNSKFSGSVDYFIKNTYNILMQIPVSSTLGLTTTPYQNVGKMRNKGIEMNVKYTGSLGPVGLNVNVMASHVQNRVSDLAGRNPIINGDLIWKEGYPYNSFYGFQTEGIYQSQEEINNHLIVKNKDGDQVNAYAGLIPVPGDIRFKDQITEDTNGDGIPDSRDGVINEDDKVIMGKSYPDWTFSSTFAFDWKGFDISLFFQGVYGINSLNQGMVTAPFHGGEANTGAWYKDGWTAEHPSKTIQRVYSDPSRFSIVSGYYLEDASYLRLKNVEVGYTLSDQWIRKIGLNPGNSRLRVYANIQNAITWTRMRFGFDPEKPAGIVNTLQYPQTRIYSMGVNVKF
ncbi:TonB-dependent receptor [Chitinophaga sp. MM2321]|uniref:TonB-dependent receptor n=1 Tax=Chitinophaga sp. MM2321 TaxID=3137178 RepID=UPI0032D57FA9